MRQRAIKTAYVLLTVLLLCCACTDDSIHASADSGMLSALQSSYRGASLIASVTCTGLSKDADGVVLASLDILEVFAGQSQSAALICKGGDFKPGSSYVAYFTADESGEKLLPLNLIPYDKNSKTLLQGGSSLPISELRDAIEALQSVISAPAELLYYRLANEVFEASDEVFIGKVSSLPALTDTDFREASGTGVVEHSRPASIVEIQVFGSVKGSLSYGESISFVYSPAFAGDILDAASLTAYPCVEADIPSLTLGSYYLFFLKKGPDPKQAYYFGVNPLQSHTLLEGDALSPAAKNEALANYPELSSLIDALRG